MVKSERFVSPCCLRPDVAELSSSVFASEPVFVLRIVDFTDSIKPLMYLPSRGRMNGRHAHIYDDY